MIIAVIASWAALCIMGGSWLIDHHDRVRGVGRY